jgi:hypothetical protein
MVIYLGLIDTSHKRRDGKKHKRKNKKKTEIERNINVEKHDSKLKRRKA